MGYEVIERIYCDCCGKNFRSKHDYSMHTQVVGGGALQILGAKLRRASTTLKKLDVLYDWFLDSSRPDRLEFDEELMRCAIKSMENGWVHCDSDSEDESDWYCSDDANAGFIKMNIPLIKAKYNEHVNKMVNSHIIESKVQLHYLKSKLVK